MEISIIFYFFPVFFGYCNNFLQKFCSNFLKHYKDSIEWKIIILIISDIEKEYILFIKHIKI